MLSSYSFLGIVYFLRLILADQCPSSDYCTCSTDLTIITCANHRLTDEVLFNLNNQFPKSTVVLNLSSNSLTSINILSNLNNLQTLDLSSNRIQSLPLNLFSKFPQLSSLYLPSNSLRTIPKPFNEISNINLDISKNPFDCTCQLKWLVKWFETINLLKKINCQKSHQLTESDFCSTRKPFLHISPSQSQIVYQNDPFTLNCTSNTKVFWTFNQEFYSNHSIIFIPHLQLNHSGLWTCHSLNQNRSLSLQVLTTQTHHFCPSIQMDTSKGHFYWPRTLTGQTIQLLCPFKSAAWLTNIADDAKAFYTCSNNRQWIDLDLSQCAFRTNVSREFDRLLTRNQTNLLSRLLNYLSKVNLTDLKFDDVIFLIDLIDEEHEKYAISKRNIDEISMLIYRLTDFILQIDPEAFFLIQQYQLALHRLRSILERLIHVTSYSWVYVGKELTAMTLESPLPPTICFVPNRPLLTIICGIANRQYKRHESRLATMQFPIRSNVTNNQSSIFRMIFYRKSTLFVVEMKRHSNPVVYMKPVVIANNSSIVKLTFYGQSNQASLGIWNSNQTIWQTHSSMCKTDQQNIDLISTECLLTKNTSLSITYLNNFDEYPSLFLNSNYLELAIYVSSIIASACFFICILFYVCCHKVYLMPRSFFHCLINYWFSLAILFPLFAFGIRQTYFSIFCQLIAVSLHYFCLTTILWLTLLSYCIWQKLYIIWSGKGHGEDADGKPAMTIVDYDDDGLPIMKLRAKPVLQFYFLAYGIPFIICGINVAISRDQYITNKICFLNNFESLLTLLIPVGIFMFLLLVFLLAARINIKRLTQEAIRLRNLPDESEAEEPEINLEPEENISSSKPNETLPMILPSSNPLQSEQRLPPLDCRQSHLDSLCSSDMDHQHQPSNQLLSILFQLILLIFIYLSCLAIYLHPLGVYNLRFEHSIYNHSYGFFVLLLAFYTLAFYVLSRSDLTMHCQFYNCCYMRKKKRFLNQSYSEPPPPPQTPQQSPTHPLIPTSKEIDPNKVFANQHLSGDESFSEQIPVPSPPNSHYSTSLYQSQLPENNEMTTLTNGSTYGSKHQTNIASKYYARHRHVLKTSVSNSETSLQQSETLPQSKLNSIQQETVDDQQVEPSPKRTTIDSKEPHIIQNGYARFHLPSVISPRTFIRPSPLLASPQSQASPSQAIIRPLPITRLSSPSTNPTASSPIHEENAGRSSYRVMPSPSTEERHATYVYLNKNSHLIQQDPPPKEKSSVWKKPVNGHLPHVAYIDEDDEGSVSLKSSACDSTSSSTTSPILSRKERSQTISSSSSSSTFSHDFPHDHPDDKNQIILHESSV